jgi:hypothetical protein
MAVNATLRPGQTPAVAEAVLIIVSVGTVVNTGTDKVIEEVQTEFEPMMV